MVLIDCPPVFSFFINPVDMGQELLIQHSVLLCNISGGNVALSQDSVKKAGMAEGRRFYAEAHGKSGRISDDKR